MSAPIFHEEAPGVPLAEVGRYSRLNAARERGLVVAAMELPHWIARHGRGYVLMVEESAHARVLAALAEYEADESARAAAPKLEPLCIPKMAVAVTLVMMVLCYRVQTLLPVPLVERGIADDALIGAGEWWRVLTALTLHGDTEHLVSNLSLAVFVFAFVFWRFGTGFGMLGIALGGTLGNALNVIAHLSQHHRSLGSSTALFAGLGLLAGAELSVRLSHRGSHTGWQLLLPIGAGFAFLALLGGGGANPDGTTVFDAGNVDVMAHLCGLLAGILIGAALFLLGLKSGALRMWQLAAGSATLVLFGAAWMAAAR